MSSLSPSLPRISDRGFYVFTAILSLAALAFLTWLLWIRRGGGAGEVDLRFLPAVNAGFNSAAATCLCLGWVAIKRKAVRLHRYAMVTAFVFSTLFLISYVVYHYVHGDTKYQGEGILKTIYLLILASHIILSMFVLPLALLSFYFAFRKSFIRHKKVTRFALPVWLYVSVTGVVIFFMLRGSVPAAL